MENEIVYVETDCVFSHEGKDFEAGGACVTEHDALCYSRMAGPNHLELTDWHGIVIGAATIRSRWRDVHRTEIISLTATILNRHYTGRGQVPGMLLRLRRVASELR